MSVKWFCENGNSVDFCVAVVFFVLFGFRQRRPMGALGDVESRLQTVVVSGTRSSRHYVRVASENIRLRRFRFFQRRPNGGLRFDRRMGGSRTSLFSSKLPFKIILAATRNEVNRKVYLYKIPWTKKKIALLIPNSFLTRNLPRSGDIVRCNWKVKLNWVKYMSALKRLEE